MKVYKRGNFFFVFLITILLSSCAGSLQLMSQRNVNSPYGKHFQLLSGNYTHSGHRGFQCSALAEFTQKLRQGDRGDCQNGHPVPAFNGDVLNEAARIPAGGGYEYRARHGGYPTNQSIDICGKQVVRGGPVSHCSMSYYLPAVRAMESKGYFKQLGLCNTEQSRLRGYLGLESRLYSVSNNNDTQWGNIVQRYGMGRVIVSTPNEAELKRSACQGDALSFSRKSGTGHQGTYLGVKDGMIYWWGANRTTNGWGVDCYPMSQLSSGDFAVSRITAPQNIVNALPGYQAPRIIEDQKSPFYFVDSDRNRSVSPIDAHRRMDAT
ncbi:MAG: hypothetical protein R3A80_02080 [Bdellovibrionota bacterium]